MIKTLSYDQNSDAPLHPASPRHLLTTHTESYASIRFGAALDIAVVPYRATRLLQSVGV